MKIFPTKLTDEELVEKIRKSHKKSKVIAVTLLVVNIILLAFVFYVFAPVVNPDSTVHWIIFDPLDGKQELICGIGIGFIFAVLLSILIMSSIEYVIIIRQPRIHRLLIKYYDMSKK